MLLVEVLVTKPPGLSVHPLLQLLVRLLSKLNMSPQIRLIFSVVIVDLRDATLGRMIFPCFSMILLHVVDQVLRWKVRIGGEVFVRCRHPR